MWNLTKQRQKQYRKCNLLRIPETDAEWVNEQNKQFEQWLDAAFHNTTEAVRYLPINVKDVFAESLRDAVIDRIVREGADIQLYLNTEGGCSSKSLIHFIFQFVLTEIADEPIQVGQSIIYYELRKINKGFAFRLLLENPDSEWTIEVKNIDAQFFYRPLAYAQTQDEQSMQKTSINEYISELSSEMCYRFITPDVSTKIIGFQKDKPYIILEQGELDMNSMETIVIIGQTHFIYDNEQYNPIHFIYTDRYEHPYAHLSEPVPMEELEVFAFSDDFRLQVRAWNTMYASSKELSTTINNVFMLMDMNEDTELMASIYAPHFYNEGVLTTETASKLHHLIE